MASAYPSAPPPWTTKCEAHLIPFWTNASNPLPTTVACDPLEANDPDFCTGPQAGKWKGGLSFAQVIRYRESPVGPYDELAILPGYFENQKEGKGSGRHVNLRITGIWVNSEASLVNGRANWNIPKHLARFEFTPSDPKDHSSPPSQVKVYRAAASDSTKVTSGSSRSIEVPGASEEEAPFFTARFQHISFTLPFLFNSSWMAYLGFSSTILQPPLPTGSPPLLEVGTTDWKLSHPVMKSRKARMVWVDMAQTNAHPDPQATESENVDEAGARQKKQSKPGHTNWWPGLRRWHLGLWCPDATLELGLAQDLAGRDIQVS